MSEVEFLWRCYPPRWLERRQRRQPACFGAWYYNDDPRKVLVIRAATAAQRAWIAMLAVIAAHVEAMPAPAGRPDDEPAPVEPLERLTPIAPNAPCLAAAREARAA